MYAKFLSITLSLLFIHVFLISPPYAYHFLYWAVYTIIWPLRSTCDKPPLTQSTFKHSHSSSPIAPTNPHAPLDAHAVSSCHTFIYTIATTFYSTLSQYGLSWILHSTTLRFILFSFSKYSQSTCLLNFFMLVCSITITFSSINLRSKAGW